MKQKNPVMLIMGPTASGKTALAASLSDVLPCEIINVDSAQFYKTMDIGSAKPNADELAAYPHRMLSFLDPSEHYSVARFAQDVMREIDEVIQRGKLPLLVGGSMLYFKVLMEGLNDMPQSDLVLRARLERVVERKGINYLHRWLSVVDATTAERLHPNDSQRILRALEVYLLSGEPLSVFHARQNKPQEHDYQWLPVVLFPEQRSLLHDRIAWRVDQMLDQGFVAEVERLYVRGDLSFETTPSIRAVGYRQIWMYLDGQLSYENMRARVIIATRQFAKRQYTWLRSLSSYVKPLLTLDNSYVLAATGKEKAECEVKLRDEVLAYYKVRLDRTCQ